MNHRHFSELQPFLKMQKGTLEIKCYKTTLFVRIYCIYKDFRFHLQDFKLVVNPLTFIVDMLFCTFDVVLYTSCLVTVVNFVEITVVWNLNT